jgi:hypothetical protein
LALWSLDTPEPGVALDVVSLDPGVPGLVDWAVAAGVSMPMASPVIPISRLLRNVMSVSFRRPACELVFVEEKRPCPEAVPFYFAIGASPAGAVQFRFIALPHAGVGEG